MYLGDAGSSYPCAHQATGNFELMSKWNCRGLFAFLNILPLSASISNIYSKEVKTTGGLVKYFQSNTIATLISDLIIDTFENEKILQR